MPRKKSKSSKSAGKEVRRVVLREDISNGQARYRVPVVNSVDNERLYRKFVYSEKSKYDRSTAVLDLDNERVMVRLSRLSLSSQQ